MPNWPPTDGAGGSASDGPAISLRGVRKSYPLGNRNIEALRGIDLAVERGGFTAIMGPSGSGKTTLLHLLGGLDRPDAGEVVVCGRALAGLSERELTLFRRREVGVVFQQFNLLPALSAMDNVCLGGLLDGRDGPALRARGMELLAELGLSDRATHRPDALSGGEQQRVAIARALLFEPPLLLADEPTGNLDSATGELLWRTLREVASRRGMTVVVVTHEPASAVQCGRVIVLRDGLVAGTLNSDGMERGDLALRAAVLARA